ncbi:hypothetical protein [Piscinibacter gummiphilus]|uniref:Uncharacterized protein n=1 Tax=Piscinibacter gummiphilus TaxID=946333 RepID=A0ABZ0CPN1_9BURK|nr:hypothetical protein [Piscinibacter gummiphilus]WOB06933.1 hypothetical protein RXV79_18645 [Piscinibacter gummiphilus]
MALVITSIYAYVSTYTASLDRKIKYFEVIITLEAKSQRSKPEEDLLTLNKKLVEVAQSNQKSATQITSAVLGAGIALSLLGALKWYVKIQARDDTLAQLQIEKLQAEIAKLKYEIDREVGGNGSKEAPATAGENDG